MNRLLRSLCIAVGALAFCAAPALACVNVGVYQDKPASTLPALQKKAGKNVKTVSTYLTVGHALDPKLVTLARKRGVKLLISWLPDTGKDSPKAPGYRLSAISIGKFDQRPEGARQADQGAARTAPSSVRCPIPTRPGTPGRAPSTATGPATTSRRGSTSARCCEGGGQEGQAALERVLRAACRTPRTTRSRCTSRAPSRSIWSAPTPTTSATPRA